MTAEQIVDNPVPRPGGAGDLQGLPSGQGSTAFSEQIAEFPDPGGGRQDFKPVQGSAMASSVSPGQAGEGFFRTFPHRKKCEDSAHPGVGTRCRVELMDAVSLAGVSLVAQHGLRRLLLVAERQEWCFLVCSSGLPSYPVAWSSCWCRLCTGAACQSWKNFLFYVAASSRNSHLESGALFFVSQYLAVIIPGVWVLLMSTRLGFFGDAFSRGCNTRLDSGYMLCISTLLTMEEFHTFSKLR